LQAKPLVLFEHTAVALPTLVVHFVPHAPQLFGSPPVRSTHDPLQFVCVPPQPEVHAELEQLGVPESGAHAWPHAPQLLLSLAVLAQTLPQLV
jgi:hypothetical protein